MQAIVPKSHPRLIDLSNAGAERFLALDCASLIAPDGPMPLRFATHCRFAELTPALLAQLAPSVVVLPLFAGAHDAMSMVEGLDDFGFRGMIFEIAPPLPRPQLVERELRAASPGARLMLVSP
jgi:hypothetical protein